MLLEKGKQGNLTLDEVILVEELLGVDTWRTAKVALSSRRHEDITITRDGRELGALVVYPDRPEKAPVVVMIPEDQGLNRWARDMADQIAAMGYIVVAPDFLYGLAPNGKGGSAFPDVRSVFLAHRAKVKDDLGWTADLNAWADYALKLPQASGKLAVVGFAWGGGRAAWFATSRKDISAAFLFYDAFPAAAPVENVTAPVYGFYAEFDPRVTRSLEATKARMAAAGKRYEPIMYPGSEHMFVRLGDEPRNKNVANILARHESLARLQKLLAQSW
nr:dienelactone hydrolase family protein [Sphingobium boeckii]